jgi:hypothetical protein
MKIYLVTSEPFDDNSKVIGAFASLAGAEALLPTAQWNRDPESFYKSFYIKHRTRIVSWIRRTNQSILPVEEDIDGGTYLIHELEVE